MAPPDFAHNVDHNAAQAAPGWPPVVVAGAYQTGIVLMRNLARRGLSVSCVDCYPEQPGFKTVYGKAHLCPYPNERPAEWVRFMVDLAKDIGGRPVLIPSADHFVTAIACHAAQLQEHFVFPQSGVAVQALLATKERQYDIAAANGFPVPRTQFIRSWEELRRLERRLGFRACSNRFTASNGNDSRQATRCSTGKQRWRFRWRNWRLTIASLKRLPRNWLSRR